MILTIHAKRGEPTKELVDYCSRSCFPSPVSAIGGGPYTLYFSPGYHGNIVPISCCYQQQHSISQQRISTNCRLRTARFFPASQKQQSCHCQFASRLVITLKLFFYSIKALATSTPTSRSLRASFMRKSFALSVRKFTLAAKKKKVDACCWCQSLHHHLVELVRSR